MTVALLGWVLLIVCLTLMLIFTYRMLARAVEINDKLIDALRLEHQRAIEWKRFAQQFQELSDAEDLEGRDFHFNHPDKTEQAEANRLMHSVRAVSTQLGLWKAAFQSRPLKD